MSNFYDEIEARVPNKSGFSRSYKNRMSMQFDWLYPTCIDEVLPNDTWKINQKNIARFAPMLTPAFADVKMYTHYYYVPRRIVEPNWKEFYTDAKNVSLPFYTKCLRFRPMNIVNVFHGSVVPNLSSTFSVPSEDGTPLAKKSLFELLTGLSLAVDESVKAQEIDLAPFIAYQYIYNENYRDSQIDEDLFHEAYKGLWFLTEKGLSTFYNMWDEALTDSTAITAINALPSEYRSGTASEIYADLKDGILPLFSLPHNDIFVNNSGGTLLYQASTITLQIIKELFSLRKRRWYRDYFTIARTSITDGEIPVVPVTFQNNAENSYQSVNRIQAGALWVNTQRSSGDDSVFANNSGSEKTITARAWNFGFTISQLRLVNALTKFEEKVVKFGLRYAEQLASHFGVIISDKTIQLPEYLGGCQATAYVNEVTQTSESTLQSAQGNYAGHMMTAESGDYSETYCEEHGYIFMITSCVAETAYSDGLNKMWQRGSDKLNFYTPEFAMLSDQEVKLKELYVVPDSQRVVLGGRDNEETFGYQGRYDEYRTRTNEFHGEFDDKLSYWHLGRKFSHINDLNWSIGYRDIEVLGEQHIAPFKGYLLTEALPLGTYAWFSDGIEMTSGNIYMIGDGFIEAGTNDSALQTIDANLTGVMAAQPGVKVGMIPYKWVTGLSRAVYADPLTLIPLVDNHRCYVTLPNNEAITFFLGMAGSLVPSLNSSFIESNVSTRIFAVTEDLENLDKSTASQAYRLIGDDYIYASFENELKVVRAMPESSEPKL